MQYIDIEHICLSLNFYQLSSHYSKLTYLTNDGNTRFHPNLYRNGKVCLSVLNTWRGKDGLLVKL